MADAKRQLDAAAKAKLSKAAENLKHALDTVKKMKSDIEAQDKKVDDLDQALEE